MVDAADFLKKDAARIAELERQLAEVLAEIERHDAEAVNMMLVHIKRAEAAEAERDRLAAEVEKVREQCAAWAGSYGKKCGEAEHLKRGLETLASTFYKDDQHQDYAKHVLEAAARAATQPGGQI